MIAIWWLIPVAFLLVPLFCDQTMAADATDSFGDALPPGAVARLGSKRLGHSSVLHQIVYSPDGKTLVSAASSICIWDTTTGRLIREMAQRDGSMIRSLAISPDGKVIAWTGRDSTVQLWDTAIGRPLHALKGHAYYSECAAFSPDGKVLVSGGRESTIRFWDVTTGKEIRTLENSGQRTTYVAYTPDGKSLVTLSRDERWIGQCRLWDLATGKVLRRWEDAADPIALSPDGKILTMGVIAVPQSPDFGMQAAQLRIWDLATEKESRRFVMAHEQLFAGGEAQPRMVAVSNHEVARSIAFSLDGRYLAVADLMNRVRVWDVRAGKEIHVSQPFQNPAMCLAFSPDGKTLAVGAWQKILLWDATTGKDLLPFEGHANAVDRVAFAPDGKTVATCSEDALILWNPITGLQKQRLAGERKLLAYAPDGSLMLSVANSIEQWDPAASKTLQKFQTIAGAPTPPNATFRLTVVFSPDGKTMASGGSDGFVRLWSIATGAHHWQAGRNNNFGLDHRPLGFAQGGKAVVTIAGYDLLRVLDAATGKETRTLRVNSHNGALSHDGRFLVTVGMDYVAPAGDLAAPNLVERVYGRPATPIIAPARNALGPTLGGESSPPWLWDLTKEGVPIPNTLSKHPANCPTFSPDGTVVAVGEGAEVVLIERASGKELRRLKGHRDDVVDLAFSPDGQRLVSGSRDRTALVWDVK